MPRKLLCSSLLAAALLSLGGCVRADKEACLNGEDKIAWQACNRECARADQEACTKAKVIEALGGLDG